MKYLNERLDNYIRQRFCRFTFRGRHGILRFSDTTYK